MKQLQKRLYNYFIPAKYMTDEEVFRKSRIFVNTVIITVLFALFYVGNCALFQMPHVTWQIALYSILFLSLLFLFRGGISLIICGNLFTFLFYTSNLYDIFYTNGLYSGTFPWLAMVPVTAILISSIRSAFVWMIICVMTAATIGILHHQGFPFVLEVGEENIHTLLITSHSGLIVIVFVVSYVMERAYIHSLNVLDKQKKTIEEEKKKSDELLLNILPAEITDELKKTGKTTARNYDLVTVLFADFTNFTAIIEELPPEELVSGIDEYFETFDYITEAHGVEKIKTVGDAYICASGLPAVNVNNPVLMVNVALDMIAAVEKIKDERTREGKVCFEIRIGIHSGPLVAGVVGVKKFAYDIWGDTVNTAARMQQCGETGRINISGTTHDLVKHRFVCTTRGKVEAKNKGLIDMYFVERKR